MPAGSPSPGRGPVAAGDSRIGYCLSYFRRHGWPILVVFAGILLPLAVLSGLVDELRENETFFFDAPILQALHGLATPGRDAFFMLVSRLGYTWGVVPFDIGMIAWLAWRKRSRDALFLAVSVLGSLLLNQVAKHHFSRARPDLWLSLAPESSFSFPSGHAMASATIAVAMSVLFWSTPWRRDVLWSGVAFTLLVGVSRVYLGVHYPSDVIAGWAAAIAWVLALHLLTATPASPSSD